MKTLQLSKLAEDDLNHALIYHLGYSDQTGDKFYDDIALAFERIRTHPEAGSPRLSQELDIAGLRAWHLKKFNAWVVYYFNESEVITVARIVHGSQHVTRDQFVGIDWRA